MIAEWAPNGEPDTIRGIVFAVGAVGIGMLAFWIILLLIGRRVESRMGRPLGAEERAVLRRSGRWSGIGGVLLLAGTVALAVIHTIT